MLRFDECFLEARLECVQRVFDEMGSIGGLVAMFRDPMVFIQMRLFVLIIGCSKL
jgi:hypothetical protein